jgi:NADH dehydrogenase FAD-containing subunit
VKVQLVTRGDFGDFMTEGIADYMAKSLRRLGVTIQDHTTIRQIYEGEAVTTDERVIPFDVCLWTGGFSVPSLARETGLKVNERGQILTEMSLRSLSHPDIFACGDAAMTIEEPGVRWRMSAFTALVTGAHAAQCIVDVVRGKTPEALSFAYYGQAIALGRHDAIGFLTYPADKPIQPYFTGWFGQQYREFFAWYAGSLSRLERRLPGVFQWQGRGRYAAKRKAAARIEKVRQSA